jgi:DNA-nicking Smr family endonuclease
MDGPMPIRFSGVVMPRKPQVPKRNSLSELKNVIQDAGLHIQPVELPEPPKPTRVPDKPPAARDEDLFKQAMEGVRPVAWPHSPTPSTGPKPRAGLDSESEERHIMQEALESELDSMGQEHPEYIEAWIDVVGRRYLTNLRSGLYSIQGQLDLHGANRTEARAMVEEFVVRMSRFCSCCVKIIHGRGINSPDDHAVLKEHLQRWLSTRRMSRFVVAYASAPPKDGGVGAVYVLLRHP